MSSDTPKADGEAPDTELLLLGINNETDGLATRRSTTCLALRPLPTMLRLIGGAHGHDTHTRHHCPRRRPAIHR